MKFITPDDAIKFTDPTGDELYTIRAPRNLAISMRRELVSTESAKLIKELGYKLDDVADDTLKKAQEKAKQDQSQNPVNSSPEVRRHMFKSVVCKMVLKTTDPQKPKVVDDPEELMAHYENADPETGAWIDKCIDQVWAKAELGETAKNSPNA